MAITKGAKKAHRSSLRKRIYNVRRKATLHDAVKDYTTHVTKGNTKEATTLLPSVYQAIDKAAKRGVISKNTANRKKSRLTAKLVKAGK